MKKSILFLGSLVSLALVSCSKDDYLLSRQQDTEQVASVASSGYLVFPNKESFDATLRYLDEQEESDLRSALVEGAGIQIPKGFVSWRDKQKSLQERMRNIALPGVIGASTENIDLEVGEEMTPEEFEIFKAEELLISPNLMAVIGDNMQVQIGSDLYTVTEVGTFMCAPEDTTELYRTIDALKILDAQSLKVTKSYVTEEGEVTPLVVSNSRITDKEVDPSLGRVLKPVFDLAVGEEIKLGNGIDYVNSFGRIEENYNPYPPASRNLGPVLPQYLNERPHYEKKYNVNEAKEWKEHTFVGKGLGKLFGHNINHTHYVDGNRRVQLYVYDINYIFGDLVGIKVRLQKKRRFLGIPYWAPSYRADRAVIGINHLEATVKENPFLAASMIFPRGVPATSAFTDKVYQLSGELIGQAYTQVDFLKDWSKTISVIMPVIKVPVFGQVYSPDEFARDIHKAPREALTSFLHQTALKWVFDPLTRKRSNTAPRMGYFPSSGSSSRILLMGLKEVEGSDYKVSMESSFGISVSTNSRFSKWNVSSWNPRDIKLISFDIFGALYLDGKWYGVQMYHNVER